MPLTDTYVQVYGQLPEFFQKIAEGEAPNQFTAQHLKDLGYNSTNHRAFIPLLKALGFLDATGKPTPRYHEYRNRALSRSVMSQAVREAYGDIFTLKSKPTEKDKPLILGKFKSAHNSSENSAGLMAKTFFALLSLADMDSQSPVAVAVEPKVPEPREESSSPPIHQIKRTSSLHYNIQIHLPATKDLEVYNAIFKSLKDHLMD